MFRNIQISHRINIVYRTVAIDLPLLKKFCLSDEGIIKSLDRLTVLKIYIHFLYVDELEFIVRNLSNSNKIPTRTYNISL